MHKPAPEQTRNPRPWSPRTVAIAICLLLPGMDLRADGADGLPAPENIPKPAETLPAPAPANDQVIEIRIAGNHTTPTDRIATHLTTRVGRPYDECVVQTDVRKLANLGWFVDVKPMVQSTPQGQIIIFQVVERPTIRYVAYLGNNAISDKSLGKQTGLKAGGSIDPYGVEEGRRKISEYYLGRGFNHVQVTILEGTKATDHGIVYQIHEGQAQKIWKVDFIGNEFVSDSRLKTLIQSKPPIAMLFKGYVNLQQIDADVDKLTAYYRSFGFFQARIGRKLEYNDNGTWAGLTIVIHEGPRYVVRNIRFLGNTKFEQVALAEAAQLQPGTPFEQAKMQHDSQWLQELYGSHGYVFADIHPETVFLEEPGEVDLLYHIDEGRQWRVGRIFVKIGGEHPHTRIQTALNRMTIRPGEILDIRELKASERRMGASNLYHVDAASGVRPKITYHIPEDAELGLARGVSQHSKIRGQSPDPVAPAEQDNTQEPSSPSGNRPKPVIRGQSPSNHDLTSAPIWWSPTRSDIRRGDDLSRAQSQNIGARTGAPGQPISRSRRPHRAYRNPDQSPQWRTNPTIRGQSPSPSSSPPSYGQATNTAYSHLPVRETTSGYGGHVVRATGPDASGPQSSGSVQTIQYTDPLASPQMPVTPIPHAPMGIDPSYQLFPDGRFGIPGQPYLDQSVDVHVNLEETQTGRLMIGAGINSSAGIVGNITIDERNFDWRRFPGSFEDIRNGTAWRGGGQRLRIDASPGSDVNRYLISFQEPYLFDTPISLGLSGSFFDRRYRDWDEERLGGRVSLGYQWVEHDLSATVAYRGENVTVSDISTPGQPDLDKALGDNALHGFRMSVINDTRDSAFIATQGHYIEFAVEQVVGSFDYTRGTVDLRQYFLVRERPDHSGRHVVSASTRLGFTGDDTPIYEHYFAGGYSTMRGFDFRGASPMDGLVEVGGEFQWLNSVQYMFPVTADEMLHGVVFCDFGTVEKNVKINDFRVAPGVGLRIMIPAMGPAPIALDFAWALEHADTDDREVFSFSLGFTR